jgi:hypothetical protein
MGWIGRLITVATVAVLAFLAASAGAEAPTPAAGETAPQTSEGPTRREYVAELEKICKPGADATQRAMKGVRNDVKENRIPLATTKFERATKIFGRTIKEIGEPARPPADEGRLKKWFTYLKRQERYLQEISAQLRIDHKIKAQRLTGRFIHNGNLANNVTLAFGFNYCSFKFSRYGF